MAEPTYTAGSTNPDHDAFEVWWREFGCKLVGHPRMITRTIAEAAWSAAIAQRSEARFSMVTHEWICPDCGQQQWRHSCPRLPHA